MTLSQSMKLQQKLCDWINKNLKPSKQLNYGWGRSMFLLSYCQKDIPEATHEDFKQAMARCGYFADCEECDKFYSKVVFNVLEKSVKKLQGRSKK